MASEFKQLLPPTDISTLTDKETFNANFGLHEWELETVAIQAILVGIDANITLQLVGGIKDSIADAFVLSQVGTSGTLSLRLSNSQWVYPYGAVKFDKGSATVGTIEIWIAYGY